MIVGLASVGEVCVLPFISYFLETLLKLPNLLLSSFLLSTFHPQFSCLFPIIIVLILAAPLGKVALPRGGGERATRLERHQQTSLPFTELGGMTFEPSNDFASSTATIGLMLCVFQSRVYCRLSFRPFRGLSL